MLMAVLGASTIDIKASFVSEPVSNAVLISWGLSHYYAVIAPLYALSKIIVNQYNKNCNNDDETFNEYVEEHDNHTALRYASPVLAIAPIITLVGMVECTTIYEHIDKYIDKCRYYNIKDIDRINSKVLVASLIMLTGCIANYVSTCLENHTAQVIEDAQKASKFQNKVQEIVLNLLSQGLDLDSVANVTGVSVEDIQQLQVSKESSNIQSKVEKIICNLLQKGLDLDFIANVTGVSVEDIQLLQEQLSKKA